jgi:hypothetical protein
MGESEVLDIGRRSLNVVGMRVGDQRSLIMEIVRQGEGHVDADKIRRPARGKISRLSFPTVPEGGNFLPSLLQTVSKCKR